jgi:hypothetical protein
MSEQRMGKTLRPTRRWLAVVFISAAVIRGVILWAMSGGLYQDTDGYRRLAENLRTVGVFGWGDAATGAVLPTAFRPPLYPLLLAPFVSGGTLWSPVVGLVHWVLGVATVGLMLVVSRGQRPEVRGQSSEQRSPANSGPQAESLTAEPWLAAILVACDPVLLYQSTRIMTETLAAFLAVVALVALSWFDRRPRPLLAGLVGVSQGLAALCRPTFLPWLLLCVLAMLVEPSFRKRRWHYALAWGAGAGIILGPWGFRNACQFGHWKFTTTHGGYTLLWGNNPSFYRYLRDGQWGEVWAAKDLDSAWVRRGHVPDAQDPLWADLAVGRQVHLAPYYFPANWSEFDDDRLAHALALRYIREQPTAFARSCLVRVARLWELTPHQLEPDESLPRRLLRYASGAWYAVLWGLALIGIVSLRGRMVRPPWVWGVLLCVAFTSLHSLYWTDVRMRAPLMPYACLLATVGAARVRALRCGRKAIADRGFRSADPC